MTILDLYSVLRWWFSFLIIGLIFFPITLRIFNNFFDKGYIFSKILGACIISYSVFILGIFHILPFSPLTIGAVSILSFFLNLVLFKNKLFLILKRNFLVFIFEELIFLLCILLWSFVRGHSPDIHGLEKFMDFGFINSIIRADYFPPKDMWLTPFSINYYYFGHLITALITKASFVSSNIAYNLMLATLFAFTFTCSFSIGANLIYFFVEGKKNRISQTFIVISGLLTAVLVSLSGNLQTVYAFFANVSNENPLPIWKLILSPNTFPNNYWYPNATRFIHNTIHEFPSYSFVVSDLHGHVLDIPIVLLTLAIFLTIAYKIDEKVNIYTSVLISFLLAVMYMTNAWDGIIYFLLASLTLFMMPIVSRKKNLNLIEMVKHIFIFAGGLLLFSLPFNLTFKPFASGIGILCSPEFLTKLGKLGPLLFEVNHCQKSPWWQVLTLHGFFYFFVVTFIIYLFKKVKIENFYIRFKQINPSDFFILMLIIISSLLIIIPELVYVKDIYPAHYRANTMFKLTYQEFIMLSIVASYVIIRSLIAFRKKLQINKFYILYYPLSFTLLAIVLIYPFFAIGSYYGELKNYHSLDGTKYLETLYPDDYKAINWINSNIKGQPVILEAQGDSYTDYARISTNTGLPTVLGWTVHEWLWRGSYDVPSPRINEVETIYNGADSEKIANLINKYNIEYVYVGALEVQKYSNLNEENLKKLGKIIYQNKGARIYKIN